MATTTSRNQGERRAETRGKLLQAAADSLASHGYAATTSRRISELAGVSLGAQTHHFPHRADLMGATIEWISQRRIEELRAIAVAGDLPADTTERLGALLDILWNDFSSETFVVFVKLWIAAAEDPDLYARLVPAEARLTEEIAALAEEIVPADANRDRHWSKRISLVLNTIRGLALTEHFEPRGRRRRDPWPETRATLIELLLP